MQLMSVSDKPCDWCGHSPTVAYKESDGSYSYVCKECRKKCAWCGKKATRHYENMMHKEVLYVKKLTRKCMMINKCYLCRKDGKIMKKKTVKILMGVALISTLLGACSTIEAHRMSRKH